MNQNNNIDKIFRDSLENFHLSPPEGVWPEIEKSLGQKEKKRVLPLWFKIAAGMALLIGSYSLFIFVNNHDRNRNENDTHVAEIQERQEAGNQSDGEKTGGVETVKGTNDKDEERTTSAKEQIENSGNINQVAEVSARRENQQARGSASLNHAEDSYGGDKQEFEKLAYLTPKKETLLEQDHVIPSPVIKDIETPVISSNDLMVIDEVIVDPRVQRDYQWIVGGSMAPIHAYRDLRKNGDDQAFKYFNSVETPILSYTGGFSLEVKTPGRLSIQSGFYFTRLGQSVENIPVVASRKEFVYSNLNSRSIVVNSNSAGPIFSPPVNQQDQTSNYIPLTGYTKKLDNFHEGNAYDTRDRNTVTGEMKQYFEYLEIPMIIKYKLIEKNMGVSLLGGISANILVGNDVTLIVKGEKIDFGETGNIKNFNYSSSLGLGFDYSLIHNLNLSIDPVFKYYLTSIDEGKSLNYHPYSIGIYTGVTYMF